MNEIKFYKLKNGKEPVKDWLLDLDTSIRVKIVKRLERIYDNNFGDYKLIAPELYELRFKVGKGYRIYYTIKADTIVLLLNAGDKSKQQKDIEIAKLYLADLKGENYVRF